MLGRASPHILCLLYCRYKMLVPTRRKRRNNRTILIAASWGKFLRAGGNSKVRRTWWSKGRSCLTLGWHSGPSCSSGLSGMGKEGSHVAVRQQRSSRRMWSCLWLKAWKHQLWDIEEQAAVQWSLLRFCGSSRSSCQHPLAPGPCCTRLRAYSSTHRAVSASEKVTAQRL